MVSRCTKRIKEKMAEQDMWVEGEFVSEDDMKKELGFSERRALCLLLSVHPRARAKAVKAECGKHKGWIRRAA